jgi:hypothetical protein
MRAAGISNVEFCKVISLQFFTIFPSASTIAQNCLKNPEQEYPSCFIHVMSSMSEIRFPFSTLLSFGNSQKSAGAMSGEYGVWSMAEITSLLKAATHEDKNLPDRCRTEE